MDRPANDRPTDESALNAAGPTEVLAYKDGLNILVYGETDRSYDGVIIMFHGGGWMDGAPERLALQAARFSRRGLRGVCAQYRTHRRHRSSIFDAVEDAKRAIEFVSGNLERLQVAARIFLLGASAGGLLASICAMELGAEKVILFNPVTDLGPSGFSNRVTRLSDPEALLSISPVHLAARKRHPPVLIHHGDMDAVVPIASSQRFQSVLNREGVRCELLQYAGRGHGFFNPELRSDTNNCFLETLDASYEFVGLE